MIWQGYMVQKLSRGPRIGHSNDKNPKFSGDPPRTPLAPPNPQQFCFSFRSHFVASRNYYFFLHLQASLDSGTLCLRAGPFTTLPTEDRALNGPWVPMVRQKIIFAGHDVRQKNFRYFWACLYRQV